MTRANPKYLLKRAFLSLGHVWGQTTSRRIDRALNYPALGAFLRRFNMSGYRVVRARDDLFDIVLNEGGSQHVLYLEFGVHEGHSLRYWTDRLTHPDSRLQGFDSFEGLPERWNVDNPEGTFDVHGRVPSIDNPRVEFVKGWFSDTLPGWEPPAHDRLVVNLDADLYSSTSLVLRELEHLLVPGTYLYFDELADRDHELAALTELLDRGTVRLKAVGAASTLTQWLFVVAS